jgi:ABC-2 type transport system ATP-binding protein
MTANPTTTTVHVEGLTRRFGSFVAVDDLSFDIHAGEIWGFLGPNGSGKSTAIRMLCGVLEPTSGSANVLGFDVARDPEAVKLRIGYMSQGASLWDDLTVEEHLRFYAGMFDIYGGAQRAAIDEWLERVGLRDRRDQLAAALPGGFRKRLALACTLLHRPKMLFLDEPTSGVDPVSRREFWDLIVGFADEGTTVLVSTHYMDEAEHCTQLAFINAGRILARGTPSELKRNETYGITVAIRSADASALLDRLDGLPFVLGAASTGSSIHVTLKDRAAIDDLRRAIARDRLAIDSLEPTIPSLEDMFASLVPGR